MRSLSSALTSAVACAALLASASAAAQPAQGTLPLERIRLYETGVGYFERAGRLGPAGTALPVPASHVDDALKTLVVLKADSQATVSGLEFSSSTSRGLGLALAGLPADASVPLSLPNVLSSLKGVRVEVRAPGRAIRGRVAEVQDSDSSELEVCMKPAQSPGDTPCTLQKQPVIVVVSDAGEIARIPSAELTSVKLLDPALRKRFEAALDAMSRSSVREMRALKLTASAGSAIRLGYIAETAVWRSTYRLVLGEQKTPARLQGWAVIHNDTDEDWRGVRAELVNGRPDSYLFPLAAPRYARRPLVTPETSLPTVPQLLEGSADELWSAETDGAGGLGLAGIGEGGGGRGEGIGLGSIGTVGHGSGGVRPDDASSALSVGNLASLATLEGTESAALFRYVLARPVHLAARSSALVPFVDRDIEAARITWFGAGEKAARAGVHLTNRTGQTLPAGTLSVFADGGFAGEAALIRLKPAESQVVGFGADLDVELEPLAHETRDEFRLYEGQYALLVRHFVRKHDYRWRLENRSSAARNVYIELELVKNATATGGDRMGFDRERGHAYAVFDLPAKSTREIVVHAAEGLQDHVEVERLSARDVRRMADQSGLHPLQRRRLAAIAGSLERVATLGRELRETRAAQDEAAADLVRLRENAAALGATRRQRRAAARLAERLLETERRFTELRARATRVEKERHALAARARQELGQLRAP